MSHSLNIKIWQQFLKSVRHVDAKTKKYYRFRDGNKKHRRKMRISTKWHLIACGNIKIGYKWARIYPGP